jgi:hypothetical protein
MKVIKESTVSYKVGYDLIDNKTFPKIEIYRDGILVGWGTLGGGNYEGSFVFVGYGTSDVISGTTKTKDEMFAELRKVFLIPKEIEGEYEKILSLCFLNGYKNFIEED